MLLSPGCRDLAGGQSKVLLLFTLRSPTGSGSMSILVVLLPLFVHVTLTFVLLIGMFAYRRSALIKKEVRFSEIALRQPNWPARATQFGNAYLNQFEMPLLFYVLTILILFTRQADFVFVLLSWVYVILRIVQSWIHVTSNRVNYRGLAFGASSLVLLIMWVLFAVHLYAL
jgi:hypothetical protein